MRECERGPLLVYVRIHSWRVNRLAHEYCACVHIETYQYM
jgi:hypothetical protein